MAIARKIGPAQSLALVGQIPVPPKLPADFAAKFSGLDGWQEALDRWWDRFQDLLQRDLDQIGTQFAQDEASAATFQASTTAALATINQQLTAMQQLVASTSAITALTAQVQALATALAAHIAANVTHQTSTPIVGESDPQALERKTVGFVSAGYGRFWPSVGVQNIANGTTVTINGGEAITIAGPFDVYGQLNIDGTLLVL